MITLLIIFYTWGPEAQL